jgi:hypothetical protein
VPTNKNTFTVYISRHSNILSCYRANQFLSLLLNAACLAEKQQIPIVLSFIWSHRGEAIKNIQSRETGNIGYTIRVKTKQKHNTLCVGYHYAKTKTHNVSKTWAPLQTTGGKDEPNIMLCRNRNRHPPYGSNFFGLSIFIAPSVFSNAYLYLTIFNLSNLDLKNIDN